MKIIDLLNVKSICLDGTASGKSEVIEKMVELMEHSGNLADVNAYKECVYEREKEGTTGIGEGIAIPHGKSDAVNAPGLSAMVLPNGVDYDSLDGQPADLIFLIAAPDTEDNVHLDVLSRLSMLLMNPEFTDNLRKAATPEEFLEYIDLAEKARFGEEDADEKTVNEDGIKKEDSIKNEDSIKKEDKAEEAVIEKNGEAFKVKIEETEKPASGKTTEAEGKTKSDEKISKKKANNRSGYDSEKSSQTYQILAVTACPTGIAHTYMAAENLENKAKEKGITIKVETDGSGGVKNALTKEDIAAADCIIIAADKNVEMGRFDGKPVIITKVADGIHKGDALIERAISGNVVRYHHTSGGSTGDQTEENAGRKAYKHLMNGVSHMLPFVVGGGILIALAFLFDKYEIDPQNFGMNTPIAAFFKTVGGKAFDFMLPILAGFIAMSIGDRPGLAIGVVGGVLASGGYTFGNLMNYSEANPVSSGFLGALLAGFAGGYLIVLLKKLFQKLPAALEGIKPVLLYPVCGIFIMGLFMIAVNPAVGAVNTALNQFLASMGGTSKIIMGAVLGGMMAVDMGGPFNKAAYVFGTAQLTVANAGPEQFQIMAAVMIGGMVPPIAIALCTTLFKNRFTENERKSGIVNYVMGLSFITEGAIPFAASDPLKVLPSCIIGSAIAGALSMAFSCGLRAPHGGIFVFGVVTNPLMYLLSLVIGSIISALILGMLKKPIIKA